MASDTIHIVSKYLQDEFMVEFGGDMTTATDLVQSGVVDSFALIQLVSHLESVFDIQFQPQDLANPLMASVDGIAEVVDRLRAAGA